MIAAIFTTGGEQLSQEDTWNKIPAGQIIRLGLKMET